MIRDGLARLDATAQAELVRSGACTPFELVDAAIGRIEALNPELNAVIHPLYDKARAEAASPDLADGPFRGVPFCVKDAVCHTAGDPYHAGMAFLRDRGWTELDDSFLATRFRRAGLVFVGKTNLPELASTHLTEPVAYGPTGNPWDPTRSTSGSSGGSAAAVASGMVPAAHGNDMGGSIRTPASECGLVGLKPTRARTSLGPSFGEYWGMLTHEGVLTRSVRDTAGLLDAIAGPMPGDPYSAPLPARPFADEVGADPGRLRVGVRTAMPELGTPPHADCVAAVEVAVTLLDSCGHDVSASSPAALDESSAAGMVLFPVAIARDLERWSERTGEPIGSGDVEPWNWNLAELGRSVSATQYLAAVEMLQSWTRRLAAWWEEGFDLLLTPTMPVVPPVIGTVAAEDVIAYGCFTTPWNITGQPAISLPLHHAPDGLPVGVQLVAAYGREDLLLRVAAQLEQAAPWADRWPPVSA
ncbi:MAG: amidase [Actinomycetota bacterium]|nr:amidase [Actinomycetota bacterium]